MSMASRAILSNFFENQWTQNHPQYLSGLSRALHPTNFHIFTRLRLFTFKFGSFSNIKALLSMSKVLKKPWKGLLLPLSLPQVKKLFIKTQNLLRQMRTKLNVLKSEMETRFVVLSLIIGRVSSEEIWPFQGFVTVSLLLVDLHPEKILFFLKCQDCQECINNLGSKWRKLRLQKLTFEKINANFWNLR